MKRPLKWNLIKMTHQCPDIIWHWLSLTASKGDTTTVYALLERFWIGRVHTAPSFGSFASFLSFRVWPHIWPASLAGLGLRALGLSRRLLSHRWAVRAGPELQTFPGPPSMLHRLSQEPMWRKAVFHACLSKQAEGKMSNHFQTSLFNSSHVPITAEAICILAEETELSFHAPFQLLG